MKKQAKLFLPFFAVLAGYAIFLLLPTDELGSFATVRASGEINQTMNARVLAEKGFERDASGKIVVFYCRDKHNAEAKISINKGVGDEIMNAGTVELFGHMHGTLFIALRAEILTTGS